MLKVRDSGGTLRTVTAIKARGPDNVLRSIAVGNVRNASNALKLFFGSLAVSLSTVSVSGRVNSSLSVAIQTYEAEALPDGGAGPYSYLWAQTGGTGTWTINSPTEAVTTFTGGNCGPDESFTATFHCTVTDAAGNVAVSGTVTATVRNIGFNVSGGGGPLP